MQKIWQGINSIITNKQYMKSQISLSINGRPTHDQKAVVNEFNNFFVNVGPNLDSKIPTSPNSFHDFLKSPCSKSFFLTPITKEEISDQIKLLDCKKGLDIYYIPTKLLKIGGSFVTSCLFDIFNHSISSGIFPDKLKVSYVIPIYKAESKLKVNNYHPISILPVKSKIFEKLISIRLNKFLTENNLLFKHQ